MAEATQDNTPDNTPHKTEEQIAVVDADNRFLYWSGRGAIHEQRLVHRGV